MILFDFSQIAIGCFMVGSKTGETREGILAHKIISQIRDIVFTHKEFAIGGVFLCCDSKNSWREQVFEHYKAARKKRKKDSSVDWDFYYTFINQFEEDLKKFLPYRVIRIDGCEGDDVIATLALDNHHSEKVLIVSNDHDFLQLSRNNVVLYNQRTKKHMQVDCEPDLIRREHILRGDDGDGVPNIRSKSDVFVDPLARQSPVSQKMLNEWLLLDEQTLPTEELRKNYARNKELVDLYEIPDYIKDRIRIVYNESIKKKKVGINISRKWFIEKGMRNLLSDLARLQFDDGIGDQEQSSEPQQPVQKDFFDI